MGHENDNGSRRKTGSQHERDRRDSGHHHSKGRNEQDAMYKKGNGQNDRRSSNIRHHDDRGSSSKDHSGEERRKRTSGEHDRGSSSKDYVEDRRRNERRSDELERYHYNDRERSSVDLKDDMLRSPRWHKGDKEWSPIGQQDDRRRNLVDEVRNSRERGSKRKIEPELSSRDTANDYNHLEDRDPFDLQVHWNEHLSFNDENNKILISNDNSSKDISNITKAKLSESENHEQNKKSNNSEIKQDDLRHLLKRRRPNKDPCKTPKRKLVNDKVTSNDGKKKFKTRYEMILELQQQNALLKSEKDEATKTVELIKDEKIKLEDQIQGKQHAVC